ncbi:hypothetical protein [Microvirga sp. P5_D2]
MPWGREIRENGDDLNIGTYAIYRQIWHYTRQYQFLLIGLSLGVPALSAAPLYFQQKIVNGLAYGITLNQMLSLGALYALGPEEVLVGSWGRETTALWAA